MTNITVAGPQVHVLALSGRGHDLVMMTDVTIGFTEPKPAIGE
jgi:hypothetical protein